MSSNKHKTKFTQKRAEHMILNISCEINNEQNITLQQYNCTVLHTGNRQIIENCDK